MQNFCDLEPSSKRECHVVRRIGRKTLFFVQKNCKMQKFSKFQEIWAESSLSSVVMVRGSLRQDLMSFILFLPPLRSLHLSFQTPDSCWTHQVLRQVMIGKVSKHVLFIDGLIQFQLQVDIDTFKPWLPVSIDFLLQWSELHPPSLGSSTILSDAPQLHNHLLILKLCVPLLQVLYSPLGSIQVGRKGINIRLLLLNDFSKIGALQGHISIITLNEVEISLSLT